MKRCFSLVSVTIVGIPKVVDENKKIEKSAKFVEKLKQAENLVLRFKEERGVPGVSVGVSVNGKIVWQKGFGYSDVENLTPCHERTVMRIASISKPLTMFLAAKLVEEGKLDLDVPVQNYVPAFPEKIVHGEKVVITTRQLVSHLGGIRHYEKPSEVKADEQASSDKSTMKSEVAKKKSEFQWSEYYNQKQYKSISEALEMFMNDPLLSKPGTTFHYTTHGWTLVSAVIEGAAGGGAKFENILTDALKALNMNRTYLDSNPSIVGCRARFYKRSKQTGRLENVPCVNSSYKWAGGGLLSTVGDLLTFAHVMVASYSAPPDGAPVVGSILKRETVTQLWTPVRNTECSWEPRRGSYAMGWCVVPNDDVTVTKRDASALKNFYVSHTGGAVGATSVLLIKPKSAKDTVSHGAKGQTVCVAVLANLQECGGINRLSLDIADVFEK